MQYRIISKTNWERRNKSRFPKNGAEKLTITQIQHFLSRIERGDGCWMFVSKMNQRYPRYLGVLCHRVSYELYNGIIPKGLVIDHLCENKWCQNPKHLEAVTFEENVRRFNEGRI